MQLFHRVYYLNIDIRLARETICEYDLIYP